MYILAIETTGPYGSAALVNENGTLGEMFSEKEMNHLTDLIPMTDRLLRETKTDKSQLSYIAASSGPGSFTGIRIGVSTARALGQALGIPVISVPTLETFKFKEGIEEICPSGKDPVICGILNARRGQVYGIVEGYMAPGPYMLTDVTDVITEDVPANRPVIFFGDGIDAYSGQIMEILGKADMIRERDFFFAPKGSRYQNAAAAGKMAVLKAIAAETLSYNDLHPDYMRRAEAEVKLAAGQLPICKLPKQE